MSWEQRKGTKGRRESFLLVCSFLFSQPPNQKATSATEDKSSFIHSFVVGSQQMPPAELSGVCASSHPAFSSCPQNTPQLSTLTTVWLLSAQFLTFLL